MHYGAKEKMMDKWNWPQMGYVLLMLLLLVVLVARYVLQWMSIKTVIGEVKADMQTARKWFEYFYDELKIKKRIFIAERRLKRPHAPKQNPVVHDAQQMVVPLARLPSEQVSDSLTMAFERAMEKEPLFRRTMPFADSHP